MKLIINQIGLEVSNVWFLEILIAPSFSYEIICKSKANSYLIDKRCTAVGIKCSKIEIFKISIQREKRVILSCIVN